MFQPWDTCASPSAPGDYGIKNLTTGQVIDLRESMGVAQAAANAKNRPYGYAGPFTEVDEWAGDLGAGA